MTEERDIRQDRATEVWRVLFMTVLGAAATVIGWGIFQVTGSVDKLGNKQDVFLYNFQQYVTSMEHRVSVLEDYQRVQDQSRARLESDFEQFRREQRDQRR